MMIKSRKSKVALTVVLATIIIAGVAATTYLVSSHPTLTTTGSTTVESPSASTLFVSKTLAMQGVQGRIDHMAVDIQGGRLFVAALANNSVRVIDISSGQLIKTIAGLSSPQGVAFDPGNQKLYVSNAGDGTLSVFESKNFTLLDKISFPGGDADNLRLDSANGVLYVGYGTGGIAVVDTASDKIVQEFPLPGHPESFQVQSSDHLIFVNVPTANLLEVVNSSSGRSVFNYTFSANSANFPMALDQAGGRLFVATRSPSQLVVFDASAPALRVVANATIPGDADDIFYDSSRGLVYVSSGQGSLEAVKQIDPAHYGVSQTIATASGARTSLYVPELDSVFVAVPASTGQQAEILVLGFRSSSSTSTTSTSSVISTGPIPTSASLTVSPVRGPSGLLVTLSGIGYVPGVTYQVCLGGYGNTTCGFQYTSAEYLTTIDQFATLGSFVADPSGGIPAGTKVTVPDLFGGNYLIGVVPYGKGTLFASAPFGVTQPTLSLSAIGVASGGNVTLTGSGYAPSTTYTVCVVPAGTVDCGYTGDREEVPPGFWIGNFTTDASGNIPAGITLTTPLQPPELDEVGVFLPSVGYILVVEAQFTVTSPG